MIKYFLLFTLLFLAAAPAGFAQAVDSSIQLPLLQNEQWWGGAVQYGYRMPFNMITAFHSTYMATAPIIKVRLCCCPIKGDGCGAMNRSFFRFKKTHCVLLSTLETRFNMAQPAESWQAPFNRHLLISSRPQAGGPILY